MLDHPAISPVILETPEINGELDGEMHKAHYEASGRVHVADFFSKQSAEQIAQGLERDVDWSYFLFAKDRAAGKKHLWEVTPEIRKDYSPAQERALYDLAYECVKEGYGFIYETNQLTASGEGGKKIRLQHRGEMSRFYDFVNSAPFLEIARKITGADDVCRAEPNATSFSAGQFLASHDDSAAATRRVAFVFNFSRNWKPDYGGLLEFLSTDGHVESAFVPYFNSLNLFRVPQAHSVSCVAPFAPGRRLAVSGWLHA